METVTASLVLSADGLVVLVVVASGWHVYGPSASDGIPTTLRAAAGLELVGAPVFPSTDHLSGSFEISCGAIFSGGEVSVVLRTQACSGDTCMRPTELTLTSN